MWRPLTFTYKRLGSPRKSTNKPSHRELTAERTSALICRVVFLSLSVAVWGSLLTVSKSTVIPKGMAISSVLAYLRPIEPLESSTLWEMSSAVKDSATTESPFNYEVVYKRFTTSNRKVNHTCLANPFNKKSAQNVFLWLRGSCDLIVRPRWFVGKDKKSLWSFAHVVRRDHVNRARNADHAEGLIERFVYFIVRITRLFDYQTWRTLFEILEVRKGLWAFFLIVLFRCWLAAQTSVNLISQLSNGRHLWDGFLGPVVRNSVIS